jgi:hypothetical protein
MWKFVVHWRLIPAPRSQPFSLTHILSLHHSFTSLRSQQGSRHRRCGWRALCVAAALLCVLPCRLMLYCSSAVAAGRRVVAAATAFPPRRRASRDAVLLDAAGPC